MYLSVLQATTVCKPVVSNIGTNTSPSPTPKNAAAKDAKNEAISSLIMFLVLHFMSPSEN